MKQYPICLSHIGITVPNLEKAIKFYEEVFGWYHLAGPYETVRDGGPASRFTDTIYAKDGHEWTRFRNAHMTTGDRIGIELFEFEGGYAPEDGFEFKRQGLFHFAVTTPDMDGFLENLKAHGGEQYSERMRRTVDGREYSIVFVKDPFGNVFELYSHSYEVMNTL